MELFPDLIWKYLCRYEVTSEVGLVVITTFPVDAFFQNSNRSLRAGRDGHMEAEKRVTATRFGGEFHLAREVTELADIANHRNCPKFR